MKAREEKLKQIIDWSEKNNDVRVVLLTSSLVNPHAPVDDFSDLDIELVFSDNSAYISDNSWVNDFGKPIGMVEEDASYFDYKHAMKMVLYNDHVKVDFKLYSVPQFIADAQESELPKDWDVGYKVLIDKDGLTQQLKSPSHRTGFIEQPTPEKFRQVLNDFWWDTTYVAKCLARDEIFYAKFVSENNIRTAYLVPLLEWYIASRHDWNITTNKYGRLFKKYLPAEMWDKVALTFSGSDIAENWKALFAMADVVAEIGRELADKLGYDYPEKLEVDIRRYLGE